MSALGLSMQPKSNFLRETLTRFQGSSSFIDQRMILPPYPPTLLTTEFELRTDDSDSGPPTTIVKSSGRGSATTPA